MTAKKTNNPFAEIAALPSTVGDVSGFAEVQNEIDELRAKMLKLIKTTSCSSVETADAHLSKAMSSLEDYFEWAGCYDDEPEVKAMRQEISEKDAQDLSREELDLAWADLRRRIKESDEPIKVRGILHKAPKDSVLEVHNYALKKTSKIERYTVIVAEEDYKYSLGRMFDAYHRDRRAEILNDAANTDESFIWFEEWIVKDGDESLYEQLHSLVGRDIKVIEKNLIVEGDF